MAPQKGYAMIPLYRNLFLEGMTVSCAHVTKDCSNKGNKQKSVSRGTKLSLVDELAGAFGFPKAILLWGRPADKAPMGILVTVKNAIQVWSKRAASYLSAQNQRLSGNRSAGGGRDLYTYGNRGADRNR